MNKSLLLLTMFVSLNAFDKIEQRSLEMDKALRERWDNNYIKGPPTKTCNCTSVNEPFHAELMACLMSNVDKEQSYQECYREYVEEQAKREKAVQQMRKSYICKLRKLANVNIPKRLQWPEQSIDAYRIMINKLFRDKVECVWSVIVRPLVVEESCRTCKVKLNECYIKSDMWNARIASCEAGIDRIIEGVESDLEENRNIVACTIQFAVRKLPEGKDIVNRVFTEEQLAINDQEECDRYQEILTWRLNN